MSGNRIGTMREIVSRYPNAMLTAIATVFLERGDINNRAFKKMTTLPSGEQASFQARWAYTSISRSKILTKMVVGK